MTGPTAGTPRRGFTLVELSAALVVMALLTTSVVVSLRQPYRRARLTAAVEELAFIDHSLRERADRAQASLRLSIDLEADRLSIVDSETLLDVQRTWRLTGADVDRVLTPGRRVDSGSVEIICSPEGGTPTYAVRLRAADGQKSWLVFAGLTGRRTRTEDEEEVYALFAWLAPRTDVD